MSIHLLNTDEPFKNHSDVRVNCGQVVRDAVFCFEWQTEVVGAQPAYPLVRMCRKCGENLKSRYLYGILTSAEQRRLIDEHSEA